MDTFSLGTSSVHRIGFGAMQLPGPGVFGPPRDHDAAIAVLRRAVELGVNHIDTAQYYGPDVSNALIREALHPYADDLVLVSKVGAVRDDDGRLGPGPDAPPSCAPASRTTSARSASSGSARSTCAGCPTTTCPRASRRCRSRTSSPRWWRCATRARSPASASPRSPWRRSSRPSRPAGIVCVQNAFSLLDRSDAAVLDRCHEAGHRLRAVLPARLRLPRHAQGHRERRGARSRRAASAPPRPRSGWPGCSRTATTCCSSRARRASRTSRRTCAAGEITLSEDDVAALDKVS